MQNVYAKYSSIKNNIMDLATNTTYLGLFISGTIVGATSIYLMTKFRRKPKTPMEERFKFPPLEDEYRLVLGIRNDLKMQKGKVAAQCGHAAVAAYAKTLELDSDLLKRWYRYGGTKITVKIEDEEEMIKLQKIAKGENVITCIVRDAGQTQVAPGTKTVIAIGPAPKSVLDKITGQLKLY